MHPEYQNQHRVSQVYLKQFGHIVVGEWKVSVYRLGNNVTENLRIADFTADFNIFDAPYGDIEFRRNFETQCSKIENFYLTIISNLQNQKQLTWKNVDVLCHFMASLLTRSIPFTNFIQMILRDEEACKRFVPEICMFSENKDILEETLKIVPVDLQLNTILGTITAYLAEVFGYFKFLVIEKPGNIQWMTTDNPVVIDRKNNFEALIPIEAEIYLPLSGDYCLFVFHESAEDKSNPFRSLKENRVNSIKAEHFEDLQKRISWNLSKYLVIPIYLEDSEIEVPEIKP
ncbi:MAG: DUF4238 domain-containing protein [Flavobacterium sp.]|nr:MAG: DUF4238 domain-containing protein [Flavobacterium sp.]